MIMTHMIMAHMIMDVHDNDEAILTKENVSELNDIPQISYVDVSKEIVVHDK